MFLSTLRVALVAAASANAAALNVEERQAATFVNQTTCNGQTYTYQQLAGYGALPGNATDKFGDTIGGIGSSIAFQANSWVPTPFGYQGIVFGLPDRGWNTEGTLNVRGRVHKFLITLTPQPKATVASPSGPNIKLTYLDTILFSGPDGQPTTGLDADSTGHLSYAGYPDLPVSTFTGDGFGGPGNGGKLIPTDNEGLVIAHDGTFWVSDEYGPYVYHYNQIGRMIGAIRPPDAFIPTRNGTESFSADSPPEYANVTSDVIPADPDSGRENNHGFEGLTASPDGTQLYVLLQESNVQEGGTKKSTEYYVRFLHYDISAATPQIKGEYVVKLPTYSTPTTGAKPNTAGQSEIHYVSPTQFLILSRDSGAGRGQGASTLSYYRHADVFDIANATNILGNTYDCTTCSIAPKGVLVPGIQPAQYCSFLDYNVNSQLNRFGVHNGGAQDAALLNEKWESLALVPVNPLQVAAGRNDNQYFLFSFSDNDFITQNGSLNYGRFPYKDASGYSLDNQILAFQVQLPAGSSPAYEVK